MSTKRCQLLTWDHDGFFVLLYARFEMAKQDFQRKDRKQFHDAGVYLGSADLGNTNAVGGREERGDKLASEVGIGRVIIYGLIH